MTASARSFSLRLFNTIYLIFFAISGVVTSFNRPLQRWSWQLIRSRLHSTTQYFTVLNEGVDSTSSALILDGLMCPSIVSHTDDQFLPCLQIH